MHEISGTNNGVKYVYIGQVKPDTEICKGVGILVYGNGYIAEGYWDNGLMNGLGRDMSRFSINYFIKCFLNK